MNILNSFHVDTLQEKKYTTAEELSIKDALD